MEFVPAAASPLDKGPAGPTAGEDETLPYSQRRGDVVDAAPVVVVDAAPVVTDSVVVTAGSTDCVADEDDTATFVVAGFANVAGGSVRGFVAVDAAEEDDTATVDMAGVTTVDRPVGSVGGFVAVDATDVAGFTTVGVAGVTTVGVAGFTTVGVAGFTTVGVAGFTTVAGGSVWGLVAVDAADVAGFTTCGVAGFTTGGVAGFTTLAGGSATGAGADAVVDAVRVTVAGVATVGVPDTRSCLWRTLVMEVVGSAGDDWAASVVEGATSAWAARATAIESVHSPSASAAATRSRRRLSRSALGASVDGREEPAGGGATSSAAAEGDTASDRPSPAALPAATLPLNALPPVPAVRVGRLRPSPEE